MKIDIYTSATNAGKHLSVPNGTDLSVKELPSTIDPDLLKVYFNKTIDTEIVTNPLGMDLDDVMKQIKTKGFAVHATKISFITLVLKP